MPVVAKSLQPGVTLSATAASVITAEAGTTVISNGVLANPTSAAVSFSLQIQRSAGGSIALVPSRAIPANETDLLPELNGRILAEGDQVLASGAGLTLVIDGNQLS